MSSEGGLRRWRVRRHVRAGDGGVRVGGHVWLRCYDWLEGNWFHKSLVRVLKRQKKQHFKIFEPNI